MIIPSLNRYYKNKHLSRPEAVIEPATLQWRIAKFGLLSPNSIIYFLLKNTLVLEN